MAFNFDPDAFVRGATGAADLYNKLTFEPEQQRQALETQRLQQQAYKNQIATSEFDLSQKQEAEKRARGIRELNAFEISGGENPANFIKNFDKEWTNKINIANTSNNTEEVAKSGKNLAMPGAWAAYNRGNPAATILEGNKLIKEYTTVLNNPQPNPQAVDAAADKTAKYMALFTPDANPADFSGKVVNGKYILSQKGKPDKVWDNPMDVMQDVQNSTKMLNGLSRGIAANRALLGDADGVKEYKDRAAFAEECDYAAQTMITPEGKTAVSLAMRSKPEVGRQILQEAIKDNLTKMKDARVQTAEAQLDSITAKIQAKGKQYKDPIQAMRYFAYDAADDINAELATPQYAEIKKSMLAQGLDPVALITAKVSGKTSGYDASKEIAHATTEKAKAEAERVKASNTKKDDAYKQYQVASVQREHANNALTKYIEDVQTKALNEAKASIRTGMQTPEAINAYVQNKLKSATTNNTQYNNLVQAQKEADAVFKVAYNNYMPKGKEITQTPPSMDNREVNFSDLPPEVPTSKQETPKAIPKASTTKETTKPATIKKESPKERTPAEIALTEGRSPTEYKQIKAREDAKINPRRIATRVSEYEKIKNDPYAAVPVNDPKTGQPLKGNMMLKDTFFNKETGLYYPKNR